MKQLRIWIPFSICLTVLLAVIVWTSVTMLNLERQNIEVQRKSAIEETVRLALWRLDSAITWLIAEESSRPYFDYTAGGLIKRDSNLYKDEAKRTTPTSISSSLLGKTSAVVNVYFNGLISQSDKESAILTSPQILSETSMIKTTDSFDDIFRDADVGNMEKLDKLNSSISVQDIKRQLHIAEKEEDIYLRNINKSGQGQTELSDFSDSPAQSANQQEILLEQMKRNDFEYASRRGQTVNAKAKIQESKNYSYTNAIVGNLTGLESDKYDIMGELGEKEWGGAIREASGAVKEGMLSPLWINDLLLLARSVKIGDDEYIQGAWLNWNAIKSELLNEINDLFPSADLVQADPLKTEDKSRMLASLPVRLVPGDLSADIIMPAIKFPLIVPLMISWISVALAGMAVAMLMLGIVNLSERRAQFVSAVTHELRTPLTTFRMYTEMLDEGIVQDNRREHYIKTLKNESNRLGHLIENVLSYARLERGIGARVIETITIGTLLERVRESLSRRASEGNKRLVIEIAEHDLENTISTDLSAVEQILLNVVDNACKYSAGAEDDRVHLEISGSQNQVTFKIRDHGPGLKKNETRMVFKPFRKSAQKAAQSAPGVGLGLALCKRLATQLGGMFEYEESQNGGACFTLKLPS